MEIGILQRLGLVEDCQGRNLGRVSSQGPKLISALGRERSCQVAVSLVFLELERLK